MPRPIEAQTYSIPQVSDALRETGALIEAARKERGWSQSELGRRLGRIDRRHISAMEKGDANTDFGLVVSALWVLDIPVLETLGTGHEPDGLRKLPGSAVVTGGRTTRAGVARRTGRPQSRRPRKKVIDNDF